MGNLDDVGNKLHKSLITIINYVRLRIITYSLHNSARSAVLLQALEIPSVYWKIKNAKLIVTKCLMMFASSCQFVALERKIVHQIN
jgi:hypothetical protein